MVKLVKSDNIPIFMSWSHIESDITTINLIFRPHLISELSDQEGIPTFPVYFKMLRESGVFDILVEY